MPLVIPSALELKTLRQLASFSGQRVLEIGVGDGRLAWPFAPEAAQWIGLDPDAEDLGLAHEEQVAGDRERAGEKVRLMIGDGQALSFPDGAFDLAFFSWSLC
jgi:ubiquinone/menaquinone biosynthesis C-methylase UbiE